MRTTNVYLVFEGEPGDFLFQEISEFAEAGVPLDTETEEELDLSGWATTPRQVTPNTSQMFLEYTDSSGYHYRQPWQDTVVVGPMVDEESGESLELIGWTESYPD